ncbi:hypothetical protein FRC00_004568 [Tulasnella sp. 408]|nr:hypothetical protein FRC00_004568 [Tulasnella sp. 408]
MGCVACVAGIQNLLCHTLTRYAALATLLSMVEKTIRSLLRAARKWGTSTAQKESSARSSALHGLRLLVDTSAPMNQKLSPVQTAISIVDHEIKRQPYRWIR